MTARYEFLPIFEHEAWRHEARAAYWRAKREGARYASGAASTSAGAPGSMNSPFS